jgi:hypothetical protein
VNGILITGDSQTVRLKKMTEGGLEAIKTLPGEKGLVLHRGGGRNLDQHPSMELYGVVKENMGLNKWKSALRLDLDTLEFTVIEALDNGGGSFHYCHPDTWYYVQIQYDSTAAASILKRLYRLKGVILQLAKEFAPIDLNREGNYFEVYDAGFVLKKDGKISVYSLPDLKEIEFKNLR